MSRSWQALPDTRGHRLILLAAAVDAFGIGVFYPLSFLYLLQHTALTSASVGLALSLGTILALPFGPLLGGPVDRFGPIRPLALSNLIAATGYVLFLSAHSFPLIVGTGFLVMLADRLYWASWPVYVAGVARGSELDDWYALVSVLKNGVVGLGALVSSVALAISARSGEALLLIDAATSVVAAALVMSQHRVARSPAGPARAAAAGGQLPGSPRGRVLRDRGFVLFCLAFTAISFGWTLPTIVLPAFLVQAAGLPHWLLSTSFGANCVLVFTCQSAITRALSGVRRTRLMVVGAGLFAVSVTLLVAAAQVSRTGGIVLASASVLSVTAAELVCGPAVNAVVAASAPPGSIGRYNALFQLTWTTSTAVAPALFGALCLAGGPALWAVVAALMLLGAAAALRSERLLSPAAVVGRAQPANQPLSDTAALTQSQ
ncbi:MFS family permease [Kitasatospora sp. GAS204A]|uniref:MFS transporter n=1 Tax=unclassified Kitasatospora TaxID=2633591 RepID=UPI0024772A44|nr:MFS transporter [Kitasatospora sp. GAS204B]MDH6117921.1 MFS family permease [Kitasatospora sp. GAS204B]